MEISGLLRPFAIIYKEFKILFHTYVYKSLIWALKFHAPKIRETMSKLLWNSSWMLQRAAWSFTSQMFSCEFYEIFQNSRFLLLKAATKNRCWITLKESNFKRILAIRFLNIPLEVAFWVKFRKFSKNELLKETFFITLVNVLKREKQRFTVVEAYNSWNYLIIHLVLTQNVWKN